MAETRLIIVPDQYVFLASLKNRGFSIGDGHPYSGLKYDSPEFFSSGIFWHYKFWLRNFFGRFEKLLNRHCGFWCLIGLVQVFPLGRTGNALSSILLRYIIFIR